MTTNIDLDTISSEPEAVTLSSGFEVHIQRMKTRQLLRGLKIFTRGAGDVLSSLDLDMDDSDAFAGTLIGALLFAIPEAENETIDFVQSMVTPAKINEDPKNKADKDANEKLWRQLVKELDNPELDDLIDIVEKIIEKEAPHITALGKRLAALLKVQTKTAAAKPSSSSKKNLTD